MNHYLTPRARKRRRIMRRFEGRMSPELRECIDAIRTVWPSYRRHTNPYLQERAN